MDQCLIDLIDRMLYRTDQIITVGYDSSNTISWKALREAENIENADFVPQLITFINTEKDKKKRDKAYFLLGHIAKNKENLEALDYLISRINKETDKYIIAALLDRIGDIQKPIGTDLQPLIQATKSDKWLIRYSAIQSLNNAVDSIAETALIEILNTSDDPYNLTYTNSTLNKIGTQRSLPYLEKHLKSKKRDVRESAKFAIEEIKKKKE